jgi:hypothetical protein
MGVKMWILLQLLRLAFIVDCYDYNNNAWAIFLDWGDL